MAGFSLSRPRIPRISLGTFGRTSASTGLTPADIAAREAARITTREALQDPVSQAREEAQLAATVQDFSKRLQEEGARVNSILQANPTPEGVSAAVAATRAIQNQYRFLPQSVLDRTGIAQLMRTSDDELAQRYASLAGVDLSPRLEAVRVGEAGDTAGFPPPTVDTRTIVDPDELFGPSPAPAQEEDVAASLGGTIPIDITEEDRRMLRELAPDALLPPDVSDEALRVTAPPVTPPPQTRDERPAPDTARPATPDVTVRRTLFVREVPVELPQVSVPTPFEVGAMVAQAERNIKQADIAESLLNQNLDRIVPTLSGVTEAIGEGDIGKSIGLVNGVLTNLSTLRTRLKELGHRNADGVMELATPIVESFLETFSDLTPEEMEGNFTAFLDAAVKASGTGTTPEGRMAEVGRRIIADAARLNRFGRTRLGLDRDMLDLNSVRTAVNSSIARINESIAAQAQREIAEAEEKAAARRRGAPPTRPSFAAPAAEAGDIERDMERVGVFRTLETIASGLGAGQSLVEAVNRASDEDIGIPRHFDAKERREARRILIERAENMDATRSEEALRGVASKFTQRANAILLGQAEPLRTERAGIERAISEAVRLAQAEGALQFDLSDYAGLEEPLGVGLGVVHSLWAQSGGDVREFVRRANEVIRRLRGTGASGNNRFPSEPVGL